MSARIGMARGVKGLPLRAGPPGFHKGREAAPARPEGRCWLSDADSGLGSGGPFDFVYRYAIGIARSNSRSSCTPQRMTQAPSLTAAQYYSDHGAPPCHAHSLPCHAMLCHEIVCDAMRCDAMRCRALPCHDVPCRALPSPSAWPEPSVCCGHCCAHWLASFAPLAL